MGKRANIALALGVAGLMAGCSGVPTSGPVVAGNPVRAQEQPAFAAYNPGGPPPGADPAVIVNGFVDAMSAYLPGYEVAKEFLTPDAASSWDPSVGVTVHRGVRPTIEVMDNGQLRMTMTVSGEVGVDGSYTVQDAGTTRELDLPVRRVDGEWRISGPPDGIIISEANFEREFESHNVCYFDPSFEVLVRDPVYLPKHGQVATLLTQTLLEGPSEWLSPAVRSAFPQTVALSVPSVPIESGIATVDLTEAAHETVEMERQHMAAQLACTLAGLSEITKVVMNADGVPLLGQDEAVDPTVDNELYEPDQASIGGALHAVLDGNVVWRPDGVDRFEPVAGPLGVAGDVTEVAVKAGGERAVAVGADGTELYAAEFDQDAPRTTVFNGTGLTSPAWDRHDVIWAVNQAGAGGEVIAARPDGSPVAVRGPELDLHDVSSVAISTDGTRMALIVDGMAYLAVVVRDGDDPAHLSLEEPRRIGPEGTALDVAWASAERLVLLVEPDDQEREVYALDVFGEVRSARGSIPGAVSVAAGPMQRIVAATDEGTLMENDSPTSWAEIGNGQAPVYP
ncbi:LpqB family beta-propeller domain-containing protein [Phytoactinopolyspora limicola]|uniref:LpqB family beta-propeller domain-containing protein n=1 Tax=Phytoactinopolyspora limicola TaxID=2715536 RepID=UPI0014092F93|nr:LpqB family beta-propeller domain-containing protein [Phytoactinopolyspora limicola]